MNCVVMAMTVVVWERIAVMLVQAEVVEPGAQTCVR